MQKKLSIQKGFTLIEIAIVLLIMGLIVGAVFSFLSVQQVEKARETTVVREQKIANALAYYAQLHYALPCPSRTEINQGDAVPNCFGSDQHNGIVPYRLLGLSQQDVTDGFGNPISYTVADLAVNTAITGARVERACRTATWMQNGTNGGPNKNAAKALFCCAQAPANALSNLNVFLNNIPPRTSVALLQDPADPGRDYNGGADTYNGNPSTARSLSFIAYTLVSHGKNGAGSYKFCPETGPTPQCTGRQNMPAPGDLERRNADNITDERFAAMNSSTGDNDNFDDIVLWRTQDRVISELGNDSCAQP